MDTNSVLAAINHNLTPKQKEAVDFEGNEMLIKGIAGSGKTTVLLRRSRKQIEKDPKVKIGIFTYNKTLRKYAEEMAKVIGSDNLVVYNFHKWAYQPLRGIITGRISVSSTRDQKTYLNNAIAKVRNRTSHRFVKDDKFKDFLLDEISFIKGKGIELLEDYKEVSRQGRGGDVRVTMQDRPVIFDIFTEYENNRITKGNIDFDDYATILYRNSEKINDRHKFDIIMVDEAQDLNEIQLKLLRSMAKKQFVVAADKGQKIYKTSFSWKDIGINILGGRTKILQNSFRSTKQIIQMAHSLQMHDSIIKDEEYVAPILPEYTGPIPDVYKCQTKEMQDTAIVSSIKKLLKEFPDNTIGVLARNWSSPRRLYYKLQAEAVPHEFIEGDKGDVHTPGVKLTTFHSAKGLEFDHVIIMDLCHDGKDQELEADEYMEVERRLLYVSITRAKKYLQIYYYDEPSVLLNEIDSRFYNLKSI